MALDLISMDISSVLISAVACGIVSFLIYLVYSFSIKEKSFEEVLAEQKKRSEQEEIQQKIEKGKKEKKFNKKWFKKSKERSDQLHDSPKEIIKNVEVKEELIADIEIVEPKEIKTKKNKSKIGSLGVNVSENANVQEKAKKVDAVVMPEKPVQEKKKEKIEAVKEKEKPKELKEDDLQKSKHSKEVGKVSSEDTAPVPAITSTVEPSTVTKKKKKEHSEKVNATKLSASKLLSLIKEAELDTEESQTLIDILLNKQKDSAGWTKKKDPLATTKKNLQEKEQLFEQELRQHQATTSKLKELREEFNQMRSKSTAQDKNSQEKIARQQQEIQTLTARVKQIGEQLATEKEKSAQLEIATEEKIESSVKKLQDEKTKMQQLISKLEAEAQTVVSQSEIETLKKSRESLQKVHSLLIEQHTQLVSVHKTDLKTLNAQLVDQQAQMESLNSKHTALLNEVKVLKESKAALETSKRVLEEKLKGDELASQKNQFQVKFEEVQKHSNELEAQVKQLTLQLSELDQQNIHLQSDLQALQAENERLLEQVISTKERVAGDGQEIVHQNGELNGKVQEENHLKSINEKDKLLKEKESVLAQLSEDLSKQKAKIAVLSEEVELQKVKNNELREKNWKAMDALTNIEKSSEQKIKDTQAAANEKLLSVQKELEEKLRLTSVSSVSSAASDELARKLKEAENRCAKLSTEYNSEIEKNKCLTSEVGRISESQKSSEFRVSEVQKNIENLRSQLEKTQSQTKECLQRIFPDLPVDVSLPHDAWLEHFEKQAVLAVQAANSSNDSSELQARLSDYVGKEKESASKIHHYEKVLAETEATLQQLQENVELQEAQWIERLSQKDSELQKSLEEREALLAEKDALQLTFLQMGQFEEMQEKLKLLQITLETAENERSHLEQKYDEVNKNCINLRDQLENKEKTILQLQEEKNSITNLKQELEDIKTRLEKEKKINKDFSSQMIRLNSLVKIGQDSLTVEQETVKNLKSQLEAAQKATANGTSATIASPAVTTNEDVSGKK